MTVSPRGLEQLGSPVLPVAVPRQIADPAPRNRDTGVPMGEEGFAHITEVIKSAGERGIPPSRIFGGAALKDPDVLDVVTHAPDRKLAIELAAKAGLLQEIVDPKNPDEPDENKFDRFIARIKR